MYVLKETRKVCGLLVTLLSLRFIQAQIQNNAREVEACAQYKQQFFEEKRTFSAFVRGADEIVHVIDRCKRYDPFIVGGSPALPKEFPSMSRLGSRNELTGEIKWFCGGTLISERYVLTAAHCFYPVDAEINVVRLGELDFSRSDDSASPEDFGVKRTIDYPGYDDDSSLYHDIGLVELDRSVTFDSFKHPACLPTKIGDEFNEFIATGWGNVGFTGLPSDLLLKVKLDRYNGDQCGRLARALGPDRLANGLNESTQLCAGSSAVKDTCNGDSGGPLLTYHENFPCMYYVVGITSAGIDGCGRPNFPGLYTRVYFYVNWIKGYVFP